MSRLIVFLVTLTLLTTSLFSQTISGLVKNTQVTALSGTTLRISGLSYSSSPKPKVSATTGCHPAYVIIPSKVVCRQRINVFFIAATDTTIFDQVINNPAFAIAEIAMITAKPTIETGTGKTILNIEEAISSVGSDVLELMLKTPGRGINNNDKPGTSDNNAVHILTDCLPSLWAARFLAW